mmetsp:Transcript_6619/g.14421  ORF Transcript_6619/g.14421 Transcript_6619/m.14421 type:complete len:126 (-) Transcript_6619:906-1283(-)
MDKAGGHPVDMPGAVGDHQMVEVHDETLVTDAAPSVEDAVLQVAGAAGGAGVGGAAALLLLADADGVDVLSKRQVVAAPLEVRHHWSRDRGNTPALAVGMEMLAAGHVGAQEEQSGHWVEDHCLQ